MNRINLIPTYRLEAGRRRACARSWIVATGGFAGFLVVMFLVAQSVLLSDEHAVMGELQTLVERVGHGESQLGELRNELAMINDRIQANRLIGGQPDWGVVLAMLARSVGDELVLTRCALHTAGSGRSTALQRAPQGAGAADEPSSRVYLELTGLGRTQHTVSQFVLRLEDHPLFHEVKLVSTHREPFHGQFAVGFLVECHVQPLEQPTEEAP
ncbi:MAG: PilN domain-containing protein [Planctomycetota bacterium]|jgi:hypothetical protein